MGEWLACTTTLPLEVFAQRNFCRIYSIEIGLQNKKSLWKARGEPEFIRGGVKFKQYSRRKTPLSRLKGGHCAPWGGEADLQQKKTSNEDGEK